MIHRHHEWYPDTEDLEELLDEAEVLLEQAPDAVRELADYVIEGIEQVLDFGTCYGADLTDALARAQALHLDACLAGSPDPARLAERLFRGRWRAAGALSTMRFPGTPRRLAPPGWHGTRNCSRAPPGRPTSCGQCGNRSPARARTALICRLGADRRQTYIAQGWKVTDPAALADIGPVPEHETLIEIPEDVLRMYVRRYHQQVER